MNESDFKYFKRIKTFNHSKIKSSSLIDSLKLPFMKLNQKRAEKRCQLNQQVSIQVLDKRTLTSTDYLKASLAST